MDKANRYMLRIVSLCSIIFFLFSCKHETSYEEFGNEIILANYKGYALMYVPENFEARNEGVFFKPIDSTDKSIRLFNKKNNIIYSIPLRFRHRSKLYKSGKGVSYELKDIEANKVVPYYNSLNYQVFKVWIEAKNYYIYECEINHLLDSVNGVYMSGFYLDGEENIDSTKLRVLDFSSNVKN